LRRFALELEELKRALLEMGALVEASIHCSVQALVSRDEGMARRVIENESCVNKMELDIDARVTRLLALNQPVQATSACSSSPSKSTRIWSELATWP